MKKLTKKLTATTIFLLTLLLPISSNASANIGITVSSKIDTEGMLLENIITDALKYHHLKVTAKPALGETNILRFGLSITLRQYPH